MSERKQCPDCGEMADCSDPHDEFWICASCQEDHEMIKRADAGEDDEE